MIRHIGRNHQARERRELREQGESAPPGRLIGHCDHCGRVHPWPDQVVIPCPGCGALTCMGEHGCGCGGKEE